MKKPDFRHVILTDAQLALLHAAAVEGYQRACVAQAEILDAAAPWPAILIELEAAATRGNQPETFAEMRNAITRYDVVRALCEPYRAGIRMRGRVDEGVVDLLHGEIVTELTALGVPHETLGVRSEIRTVLTVLLGRAPGEVTP